MHLDDGWYIVYNGGPDEACVAHWPYEPLVFKHELSDVMSGPYSTKADCEIALDLANEIASNFRKAR